MAEALAPWLLAFGIIATLFAALGAYLLAWWVWFRLIGWLRRFRLFRWFRWRNRLTVLRLRWLLLGLWPSKYPAVVANMTEHGLTSFTIRWTRRVGKNTRTGWAIDTPGPGYIRQQKNRRQHVGDVARLPRLQWSVSGEFAEEPDDEFGPFPIYRSQWNGYHVMKRRRPGQKRSYLYEVEEAENAHFRTLPELLEALGGWEPVVGMSKNGAGQ